MDPSKSRPPLTVQEFLSIIRGDPRPEASAAFVDAVESIAGRKLTQHVDVRLNVTVE